MGIGVTGLGFPGQALPGGGADHGGQVLDFGGGHEASVDAQFLLHCDVLLQSSDVFGRHGHQVSGAYEPGVSAHNLVEVGKHFKALPSHGCSDGVGIVHPADGLRAAGGPGAQDVLFDQHGVGQALPGEVCTGCRTP